jgi:hypothetical protein
MEATPATVETAPETAVTTCSKGTVAAAPDSEVGRPVPRWPCCRSRRRPRCWPRAGGPRRRSCCGSRRRPCRWSWTGGRPVDAAAEPWPSAYAASKAGPATDAAAEPWPSAYAASKAGPTANPTAEARRAPPGR